MVAHPAVFGPITNVEAGALVRSGLVATRRLDVGLVVRVEDTHPWGAVMGAFPGESALSSVLRQVERAHLRPDPTAVREALSRADRLVQELHFGPAWMFRVVNVHPHGSLSRGTGIKDFNDLDRLVELDPVALRTREDGERTAADTIQRMKACIEGRRGGLVSMGMIQVRAQDHSVGVTYPAKGLHIDLVPAVRRRGRLMIPERDTGEWLQADPAGTAARLKRAKAVAPHAGVVIRLLKGWARARGHNAPIGSFAIETLVVNAMLERPSALDEAICTFFHVFADAHAGRHLLLGGADEPEGAVTLIEPLSGNNLTSKLSGAQRKALVDTCRTALLSLGEIDALTRRGKESQAQTAARRLFVPTRT